MVLQAYNPSTWDAEAAYAAYRTLSQKKKKKKA
jgi:hypothetical protein